MGIVTYYLDNLVYDHFIAYRVRMAMNTLETSSCMRFKPILVKPTENITWIHITNPEGERNCVHKPIYKKDGEIILVLGFDCLKEHEITHSLLHAIGFNDEVSHPHRDQYIRVMWNNIHPEYRHLYRIQYNEGTHYKMLVEYDPLSVMHFHDRAFSMNGHATVMPLVPGLVINPMSDLSQLDKMKLRLLFDHECNKRKVGDMIDTCKIVLTNNTKSKDDENKEINTVKKIPSTGDGVHIESDAEIHEIGLGANNDGGGKNEESDNADSEEIHEIGSGANNDGGGKNEESNNADSGGTD
ncbi:zinc metalloproteinase nas-15-like [Epargyreus clarus]|uniref:zinc metalloproteinase nas-15-like n=1 Tax=Epargyreus clarus TaxID=520877 RepID=UPI003C2BA7FE